MRWAQLLKRVFDIDIEQCSHPYPSGAGRTAAPACAGRAGGSVCSGLRRQSGLVLDRAGVAFGQPSGNRLDGLEFRRAGRGICLRSLENGAVVP